MKIAGDLALFQTRLGYRFKQPSGLIEAVTHASKGTSTRRDYQRLEFLGDRVLGLVIAQALLAQDPEASEGIWLCGITRWCAKKPAPKSRAILIWERC